MKSSHRLMLGSILGSMHFAAVGQTTVSTEVTTPLNTQTAGNITVTEDGSITVASGTPVTIDSAADLAVEEGGYIEAGDAPGTSAVLVTTGGPFSISNEGSILVEEDFVPVDDDSNNIPDGAIAESSDRAGIRITSPSQGTITNEGSIHVEGLNSYGIVAEGSFTGDIFSDGTVSVIGDYSKAISLQFIDGNVVLEGQVYSVGEGSQALVIAGDVTGSVRLQGLVGQSMSFANDDDYTMSLSRGDLRVRAPAVEINGSVAGGILVAAPPHDLDDDNDDEDNDEVDDDDEGTGALRSYGVSPALYIGGASPIEIGGVAGREGTYSLAIDGSVSAAATYSSISSVAVEIGGEQQTELGQGIGVTGTVSASTYDSGSIAILLNETAVVPSLYNSGTISATISSSGDGSTIAVLDRSGTLTNVSNTGFINAGGSREDVKVALDLSQAASAVTVHQYLNDIDADTKADEMEEEDYDPDNPTIYTAIYGDILLGSFDDTLDVSSGVISGYTYFNDGDDSLSLSDDAVYSGKVYGGNGELSIQLKDRSKFYGMVNANSQNGILTLLDNAAFTGTFEQAENLSVDVQGGTLTAEDGKVASFGNLTVASGGAIKVIIDGEEGTSSSFDVGTAQFDQGSKVLAEITSISDAEGTYEILTADQITGAPTFDPETNDIPLLYSADLAVNSNNINLTIQRKTAQELGFNTAQGEAYDAILQMLPDQSTLETSILQAESLAELGSQFQELLPDYSGGVFEFATHASRLASVRIREEPRDWGKGSLGSWVVPFYFQSRRSSDDSDELTISGKGIAGGFEAYTPLGSFGADLSYTDGDVKVGSRQDLGTSLLELGAYWRQSFGPIYTFARVAGAEVKVASSREFEGVIDDETFTYTAEGDWKGLKLSGTAGASARLPVTNRLTLKPAISVDYQRMREKGYDETGDDAIVLSVDSRKSSRLTALAALTSSFRIGKPVDEGVPITLDIQGGRRFNLVEKLGDTAAYFEDGDRFSLTAPANGGRWLAEAKLHGGGVSGAWALIAGAEKGKDQWSANVRAALSVGF